MYSETYGAISGLMLMVASVAMVLGAEPLTIGFIFGVSIVAGIQQISSILNEREN